MTIAAPATPTPTPTTPVLGTEVHVWSASLDGRLASLGRLGRLLSEDEFDRAARFHFDLDRARFVVGRGLLRTLLASYTGQHPAELCFSYTTYGKPELQEDHDLHFNLAHSGGRALFAICIGSEIGVDLERVQPGIARERVAEHFFSALEVSELRALPAHEQDCAFLACWTRKEAYVKATGEGLSLSLQDFDVTLRPGDLPALRRTAWSELEPSEWRLHDLSAFCPGHVAALAIRSERVHITTRHWYTEQQC
jgi:4'-phosphopantetheinyl transferase